MVPRNIPGGLSYGNFIDDAISHATIFIVICSESPYASQWCQAELNIAFTEQKRIIPFRIDDVPLKGSNRLILNQAHWIDTYPDYDEKFKELVESYLLILGRKSKVVDVGSVECMHITIIMVEGGTFTMGVTKEQGKDICDNERPVRKVTLSDFWISESPVTVNQDRDFCNATGRDMPPAPNWGWINNHTSVNVSWDDVHAGVTIYKEKRLTNQSY